MKPEGPVSSPVSGVLRSPESYEGIPTHPEVLDSFLLAVREAKMPKESDVLHFNHSDLSVSQPVTFAGIATSSKLLESQNSQPLDFNSSAQITSFDPSVSDVHPPERYMELDLLHFQTQQLLSCTLKVSRKVLDSKALDSDYSKQIGNFSLSIIDVRAAEKTLVQEHLN
ncbi:hypothetical protein ACET3Z_012063 [Daucus carota]